MKVNNILRFVVVCFSITSLYNTAMANNIAICGSSNGISYFPEVGVMIGNKDASKWVQDKIKGGTITLTLTGDKQFDLLFSDSYGRAVSSKQDGAKVLLVGKTRESATFAVIYPKLTEVYSFVKDANSTAKVIWSTHKFGTPVMKFGVYAANCSLFDIQ